MLVGTCSLLQNFCKLLGQSTDIRSLMLAAVELLQTPGPINKQYRSIVRSLCISHVLLRYITTSRHHMQYTRQILNPNPSIDYQKAELLNFSEPTVHRQTDPLQPYSLATCDVSPSKTPSLPRLYRLIQPTGARSKLTKRSQPAFWTVTATGLGRTHH
jgi:hypothetical protein